MSLRQRITIVGSAAVAVAVVLACTAAYIAVRGELLGQVDDQLRQQAEAIQRVSTLMRGFDVAPPAGRRITQLAPQEGGPLAYIQVGSSRVDLQACKLEYSIVSPK